MFEPPKQHDFKLLPTRIDWLASHSPHKPYAMFPKCPKDIAAGFEVITFLDFANTVNNAAWWLKETLDEKVRAFAYSGPSDLRWSALLVAAVKTGKMMIHVPSWLCVPDMLEVLKENNCSTILVDSDVSADAVFTSPFAHERAIPPAFCLLSVPPLSTWLDRSVSTVPVYEYAETWDEAADKSVAAFYVSSQNGLGKLEKWSNRRIAFWDLLLDSAQQNPSILIPDLIGNTVFTAFSPANMDGHSFQLFLPIYLGYTVVMRHPGQKLDSKVVRQIVVSASCNALVAPPGVLATLIKCPRTLGLARTLDTVVVCGEGYPKECTDFLSHPGLRIQNIYGQTEVLPSVQKRELTTDVRYIAFHELSGAAFIPDSNGLWELTFQRDTSHRDHQPPFMQDLDANTISTGDLFSPHPRIPNRWAFEEHKHDRVVLSYGEKVRTSEMERVIGTHMLVKTALIYGHSRCRPLLVIEPWSDAMDSVKDDNNRTRFLEEIWPFVEEANQTCSLAGRLCRPLTLVMRTPLVRTPDRTIDRIRTLAMVVDEVEQLYNDYQESAEETQSVKDGSKTAPRTTNVAQNLRRLQVFREVGAFLR